jgi:hypothetical protein
MTNVCVSLTGLANRYRSLGHDEEADIVLSGLHDACRSCSCAGSCDLLRPKAAYFAEPVTFVTIVASKPERRRGNGSASVDLAMSSRCEGVSIMLVTDTDKVMVSSGRSEHSDMELF